MSQQDVIQYYESIAGDYDESRFGNSYGQFLDAQERSVLDKLIDMREPGCRLDLACGTGRLTGYATHGLDASAAMMERALERHPGWSSASHRPVRQDIRMNHSTLSIPSIS